MKVTVYSAPWCPWCQKTKEFLKENGIEFTDKNIDEDEQAKKELIEKSGQMGIPVTDVDGEIIVGFDKTKLKEVLKLK